MVVFDNCDSLTPANGSWSDGASNTLEIDTVNKKEGTGCILGTFSGGEIGWGGQLYKSYGTWDIEATPILRLWIKLGAAFPEGAEESFYIITTGWQVFFFDIFDGLPLDTWTQLEIDLRQPDSGPIGEWPNLADVVRMGYSAWVYIPTPIELRWDDMEVIAGPPLALEGIIDPATITGLVDKETGFEAYIRGGTPPYTYQWYVDDVLQPGETSTTFSYAPTTEDAFTIKCNVADAVLTTINPESALTAVEGPPPTPESLDVLRSEIRGMFINQIPWDNTLGWDQIAGVCYDYGINAVFIDLHSRAVWDYNAQIQDPEHALMDLPELRTAITAFHDRGVHVHILYAVGIDIPEPMSTVRENPYGPYWWMCFEKATSKTMMHAIVADLAANYDIDGFMFDYARYQTADECFCNECETRFKVDTGLTGAVFPTDVLEAGTYYWDFLQWRLVSVTEMVRDIRLELLAQKPDIPISAVVLEAFQNCGNFGVSYSAQHTADWVDKGYLDFVSPMCYSTDPVEVADNTEDSLDYYNGGAEGKLPCPVFSFMYDKTVAIHTSCIQAMMDNGADGWIIWRYGGPGQTEFADIRPYLTALMSAGLMGPVWAIQDLGANQNESEATISWETTAPATSKVERKEAPMFVGTERSGDFGRPIVYKDIDYTGGIISQDLTLRTSHAITIPVTEQTQVRVQSTDANGLTITSSPMLVLDIPLIEGEIKMEQAKYDSLKTRLRGIRRTRAQWSDEAVSSALMAIINEILDALAP